MYFNGIECKLFLTLQNSPEIDRVYSLSHNSVYSWWFVFERTCLKDDSGGGAGNEWSYRKIHPILKCEKRVPCSTVAPAVTSALNPGKNMLSHRRCSPPTPRFIGVPFRISFIVRSGRPDILFTVRSVWARTVSVVGFLVLCDCFCAFWPKFRWNKQMAYYFFKQYVTCWFKQLKSVYVSGRPVRRIWIIFPSLSKETAWRIPLLGRRKS